MTDVLLGQSYFLRFDPKLWDAMQPYPPLGTMLAAAMLRERGYDVALFDAMLAESEGEWAAALDATRPRLAVLFEDNFNYLSKMCLLRMREAAFRMMGMAKARGCTVIVGGADATDHTDLYLAQGADYVLLGEGEQTLLELVDALSGKSNMPPTAVAGLAWLDDHRPPTTDHGQATTDHRPSTTDHPMLAAVDTPRPTLHAPRPRRSAPRPLLRDLDALPFPAWDLIDVERYRRVWTERHGYYSMNMVTTRGCPYHCNWCAKPIWGQRYTVRSPESVAREMRWLKDSYAPDHISFVDDIMGLKPGWLEAFGAQVEAQGAAIPFKCLSRADLLKESVVDALCKAGCNMVWIGAESGSQQVLDAMNKGTTVEQIYAATHRLHAAGIQVAFFLQFGYPGEDRADIEATLRMMRECLPDDIGMSVSYPLPGTKFYDNVRLQLGDKQNWQDSADLAMLYRGPYSTEFYRHLHAVLHKEFRARRTWARLTGATVAPAHPLPTHRESLARQGRQVAGMVYHAATLPLARRRLDALARESTRGLDALPPLMSHAAAATPSAQPE